MSNIKVPLYAEAIARLRNAPTSSDWFPFPTNFFQRPEVARLPPASQLHAARLMLLCCTLHADELPLDARYIAQQIGADVRHFSFSPFLKTGFLLSLKIEREKEEKEVKKEATARQTKQATLDELSRAAFVAAKEEAKKKTAGKKQMKLVG